MKRDKTDTTVCFLLAAIITGFANWKHFTTEDYVRSIFFCVIYAALMMIRASTEF